jgi:hypothetical protein
MADARQYGDTFIVPWCLEKKSHTGCHVGIHEDGTRTGFTHSVKVTHRIDRTEDCCTCGGQIVYFEDGDRRNHRGYGCESAELVFANERERSTGR